MAKGQVFLIHWHAEEAEVLAAPLRRDGWDVAIESADGARAGRAILAKAPAAVVVSLSRLPSHGRATMRGLRGSRAGRAIPIIFVDGDDAVVEKTRSKVRDAVFVQEPGPQAGARPVRQPLKTADFDYALPAELIAQHPVERRDESRLLVMQRGVGSGERFDRAGAPPFVAHRTFRDFPSLVEPGDVVVINDSRVIPARLLAKRKGGGAAEVLLVTREADGAWRALVKPGARIRAGARLDLLAEGRTGGPADGDHVAILEHLPTGERRVRLEGEGGGDAVLLRHGRIPLPPYITREPTDLDRERYQTVYAKDPGSVAAPTAGLHFTDELLRQLEGRGVRIARVTLHVGPGTFRPVSSDEVGDHHMDAEAFMVPEATAEAIAGGRAGGRAVWAVGTTALRVLETVGREDGTVAAGAGWTTLFVTPGYRFKVVDRLLTNFHLPRSTLLMLVCAFAGTERTLAAYHEAVARGYRFYSYGDAMVVT